jgi:hypothetical protein
MLRASPVCVSEGMDARRNLKHARREGERRRSRARTDAAWLREEPWRCFRLPPGVRVVCPATIENAYASLALPGRRRIAHRAVLGGLASHGRCCKQGCSGSKEAVSKTVFRRDARKDACLFAEGFKNRFKRDTNQEDRDQARPETRRRDVQGSSASDVIQSRYAESSQGRGPRCNEGVGRPAQPIVLVRVSGLVYADRSLTARLFIG